jgi:hypothetical protein
VKPMRLNRVICPTSGKKSSREPLDKLRRFP